MSIFAFLMLSFTIGGGIYFLLGRRFAEVLIGLSLTSNGINLLLIEVSHPSKSGEVDPVPQALILTAIVIGLSLLSFMAAFTLSRIKEDGSDAIPAIEESLDD